jgi:hypothetical protein
MICFTEPGLTEALCIVYTVLYYDISCLKVTESVIVTVMEFYA